MSDKNCASASAPVYTSASASCASAIFAPPPAPAKKFKLPVGQHVGINDLVYDNGMPLVSRDNSPLYEQIESLAKATRKNVPVIVCLTPAGQHILILTNPEVDTDGNVKTFESTRLASV
jgi:hypothetical protein